MRRLALVLLLAGCDSQAAQLAPEDETTDEGGSTSTTGGSASSGGTTGVPEGSTGWEGSTGVEAGSTGLGGTGGGSTGGEATGSTGGETTGSTSGVGATGEPCDPGTHGCECYEGDCAGDLVCGEGGVCWEPGECQGVPGTEGCGCSDGACFGEMQCWEDQDLCVASCTDDPMNDDQHCGGVCGNECAVGVVDGQEVGGCSIGECVPGASECFPLVEGEPVSCDEICGNAGFSCGHDCGTGWEAVRFYSDDCSGDPLSISTGAQCASVEFAIGPMGPIASAQCCCSP